MKAEIYPSTAAGEIKAPPSKSDAHRALICAALAGGGSRVSDIDFSDDILATLGCLQALGAEIEKGDACVTFLSPVSHCESAVLSCRESGSTLRFLIPLASIICEECVFTGSERLFERPLEIYENIFASNGSVFEKSASTLRIKGAVTAGKYEIPGNISSQFISGLLFALPLCDADSEIIIQPPFESRPYVDMTVGSLRKAGIEINSDGERFYISGSGKFKPFCTGVEGDWSNAAFFDALNYLGGNVNITGLDNESLQGDKVYRKLFAKLKEKNSVIDLKDCPDLGPVCMGLAYKNGCVFTGTGRLTLKESDRCACMAKELAKFGIKTEYTENSFTVFQSELQPPISPLDGHNDHRIVMALCSLCTVTGGVIEGAQAVSKSLPGYFDMLKTLGIKVNTYEAS